MSQPFALYPRLAADTRAVISLPLCDVRLMHDARYVWLLLVPRRADVAEVIELGVDDQARLWREVASAASALRATAPCDKLNIGALGNIVDRGPGGGRGLTPWQSSLGTMSLTNRLLSARKHKAVQAKEPITFRPQQGRLRPDEPLRLRGTAVFGRRSVELNKLCLAERRLQLRNSA